MDTIFSGIGGALVGIVITRLAVRTGASLAESLLLAAGMSIAIMCLALGMGAGS